MERTIDISEAIDESKIGAFQTGIFILCALCLSNDLIWWIPFALYLKDAWRFFYQDIQPDIARLREYAAPRAG